jgi:hypothetical protein
VRYQLILIGIGKVIKIGNVRFGEYWSSRETKYTYKATYT